MPILLVAAAVACAPQPDLEAEAVQRVVDDLAAQRFGRATARYQQDEALILTADAAPRWRRALRHEDPTVRQWAVDALARIDLPEDVPLVVETLDDPFRKVQESAAEGLIAMDPEAARQAFTERLEGDDPVALMIAAQGFADLGDPGAVGLIGRHLRDPSLEPGVRGVMAQVLGTLGDPGAAAALADVALESGADLQMRRTAAEALATLEGGGVRAELERLLQADDDYIVDTARRALETR